MRVTRMMASAALITLMAAALPANASAGDLLSGVGARAGAKLGGGSIGSVSGDVNVGGISAGAGAAVGGSSGGVNAKVNASAGGVNAKVNAAAGSSTTATAAVGTVTGKVLDSSVNAAVGTAPRIGGSTGKAKLASTVEAKARLLSAQRLLTLCVTVGAKGCESASRSRQLALIKARLGSLSGRQLLSACVAVGGGCGNGGGRPGPVAGGSGAKAVNLANASGSDRDREMRISCRRVISQSARYEAGLVQLCRKMLQ